MNKDKIIVLTKLFKVKDGSLVRTIQHNETEVSAKRGETNVIHFTADDKFAVTGMDKTGAKIWDLETGAMVKNLGHGQNTVGAAFSPDNKWIAVAHDRFCAVYSLWDYRKVAEYSVPKQEVNAVDWAKDASLLMLGGDAYGIKIVRTSDWQVLHDIQFPTFRVKSVAISPDGKYAAACGQNGLACIYKDIIPATIEIKEAGPVTINVWPREDGIQIDKLVLTLDAAYQPADEGPSANTRFTKVQ